MNIVNANRNINCHIRFFQVSYILIANGKNPSAIFFKKLEYYICKKINKVFPQHKTRKLQIIK